MEKEPKKEEVEAQNLLTQINEVISELEDEGEEKLAKDLHNIFLRLASKVKENEHK